MTAPFPDPIPKLLPFGSICTFSGASGVGKTAFLATLVGQLQRGESVFGHQTNPPPAIGVLACDRPWRDHRAWFEKAGVIDLPHYSLRDHDYAWEVLRDWRKTPAVFGSLVDAIQLPPGSLLIVDPVSLFIAGRLMDYKDMAIGLGLLDQQLKPRQLTMLGIFHVSKQKTGNQDRYLRPQDRILGSAALIGYSETAFYLLSPEEAGKPHYEFGYVAHQLPAATFSYKRNDEGIFVPAEYLDVVQHEETALALLPPDPTHTLAASIWNNQIQAALPCSERTAFSLIGTLRRAGRVVKVGRGLYRRALPN